MVVRLCTTSTSSSGRNFPYGLHLTLWAWLSAAMGIVTTVAVSDLAPDWWLEISIPCILFAIVTVTMFHRLSWVFLTLTALVSLGFSIYRAVCLVQDWTNELNENITHGNCGDDVNYQSHTVIARIFSITNICLLDAVFFVLDTLGMIAAAMTAVLLFYMMMDTEKKDTGDKTALYEDGYQLLGANEGKSSSSAHAMD